MHLCPKSWERNFMQGMWRFFLSGTMQHERHTDYGTWSRNILFCEDENLTITPSKENLNEYSIYDLRNQRRGRQVLIQQDEDVIVVERKKDAIACQDEGVKEVVEPQNENVWTIQQNEDAQNGDVKVDQ
jgi:hypothetical protein